MKQRIFVNLFILAAVTALLTSLFISYLMYESNYALMKEQVKKDVHYLAEAADSAGIEYLLTIADLDATDRITLIDTDGTVAFDSLADNAAMGNHLYRPEIAAAFAGGYGEAVRRSDTLETQTYYCAVLLDNGMVLRLANDNLSVWGILFSTVNYILASLLIIFILALIIAKRQTKKIIEPINSLDLDNPEHNQIYEEIHPLINRLSEQNRQINEQIARLNSQKQEFLAITENMNEGLLILSKEGKMLSANLSARRFFGLKDNEGEGKHFLELNRSESWQSLIYNALDDKICEQHLNFEGRVYRLLATPSRRGEELTGAVVLLFDETEKAEADLRRKEFSANVSHELKTPLTAISGYAELISGGLARPEDIPAFASKIYEEAARLREMVDNIIKLSRLDEEKNLPQKELLDLLPLAQTVCGRLQEQAAAKAVSLSIEGQSATVYGSRQILDELIFNLADNAVKYNHQGGEAKISVAATAQGAVLTVSDSGLGIASAQQDRIFERFYRIDKSHSKTTEGSGLGLSIVKYAAFYHNATISLQSEEGHGSTFTVRFPVINN